MSKDIEWSDTYGVGEIVCTCDGCHKAEERFQFEDNEPNYRAFQKKLYQKGWLACKVNGYWKDFCCDACRDGYIKRNT